MKERKREGEREREEKERCARVEDGRREREGEKGWKRERDVVWGLQELLAC